jgi:hypothetical protein
VGVTGPFTFKPGDEQDIDIAFVWARDYTSKSPAGSLDKLRLMADKLNTVYVTNKLPNGQPFFGTGDKSGNEVMDVNIYPNPARDRITVEFCSNHNSGPATIYLFNNQGRTMKSVVMPENSRKANLEVSDIPAGFYLLKIMTRDDVVTKKVFVTR